MAHRPANHNLTLADFDYALPAELIAQEPARERASSRLLHMRGEVLFDRHFADLRKLLQPGDLLVLNDTRVIKARLSGEKASGGRIEVLIERVLPGNEALGHIRASHAPKAGAKLRLAQAFDATVLGRQGDLYRLRIEHELALPELLERHGEVPLPPYITHVPSQNDEARYQTVYARAPGAVAAPTAGLHFDNGLMDELQAGGIEFAKVTLHVGAGTFQPVRVERLAEHRMHAEQYDIPGQTAQAVTDARQRGSRVIAVGTTSMRALESAADESGHMTPGEGETNLFILPGYRFRIVDAMITNFHLPKSTLLMLVSAFAGIEPVRRAYHHAIAQRYRFFSYGDAMVIERNQER